MLTSEYNVIILSRDLRVVAEIAGKLICNDKLLIKILSPMKISREIKAKTINLS
jgi:hypothetical protein